MEINTYPWHIRRRSNLGRIFRGKKSVSYGPRNTVFLLIEVPLFNHHGVTVVAWQKSYMHTDNDYMGTVQKHRDGAYWTKGFCST